MYTLHIANKNYSSWSLRPWVLMKEKSILFHEKISPFKEGSNWKEFRTFSPSGLVPCLIDEGKVIWDSLAIIEYLAEKHTGIWPVASNTRAWSRCVTAEMHSGFSALREQCPMNCGLRIKLSKKSKSLLQDISRIDELWSEGLLRFGGPFLAGNKFTVVDAFFAPVVFRIQTYGLTLSSVASKYVGLLLSIKSMRNWEEQALKEPWREHRIDSIKSGILLEDFRES